MPKCLKKVYQNILPLGGNVNYYYSCNTYTNTIEGQYVPYNKRHSNADHRIVRLACGPLYNLPTTTDVALLNLILNLVKFQTSLARANLIFFNFEAIPSPGKNHGCRLWQFSNNLVWLFWTRCHHWLTHSGHSIVLLYSDFWPRLQLTDCPFISDSARPVEAEALQPKRPNTWQTKSVSAGRTWQLADVNSDKYIILC